MGKISLSGEPIRNGSYDDDGLVMGGRFFHKALMDKLRARARADQRRRRKGGGFMRRRRRPASGVRPGYPPRPRWMRGEDEEILLGFDRMTDDEIMYTLDNSPYPEYMGGKLKDWFKRRKTRAKAFVKKVKAKYKKLPKWAKVVTGAVAAPLALAAAPAALAAAPLVIPKAVPAVATALIAKKAAREKALLAKMTPEQRKAYLKKKAKRLGIAASILVPGFGITTATTAGTAAVARKIAKTVKARQQARALQQQQAAEAAAVQEAEQPEEVYQQPAAAYQQPAAYTPAPAKMQAVPVPGEYEEGGQAAAPAEEKKGGGLGTIMALGAMALPFFLKK